MLIKYYYVLYSLMKINRMSMIYLQFYFIYELKFYMKFLEIFFLFLIIIIIIKFWFSMIIISIFYKEYLYLFYYKTS